jgi:nucleoside-diphosphate-sugar epimerase
MNALFCIGYGYSATHVAALAKAAGWQVYGTSRKGGIQAHDVKTFPYNVGKANRDLMQAALNATHILVSVPPELSGPRVWDDFHEIIRDYPKLVWFGYLSTTGVYGDHQGGWVDETTPVNPPEPRSAIRVKEENEWLSLKKDFFVPAHIFRISGIYGAGRSAIDQVRARQAQRIDKPNQFFSRIHVEDIAGALWASMQKPTPGEIYNLADDLPSAAHEPVTYACELLDVMPPVMLSIEAARLSVMARSFYAASRKVSNAKMKEKLGYTLKYPTFKEGLQQVKQALKIK